MTPRIINPIPSGRPLPVMYSFQDAAKLNLQERTTFYVSAFLFQVWLCEITLADTAQLAEKPNPNDRAFQTGEAWRGFLKHFGRVSDAAFADIYIHLGQFAEHDDALAAYVRQAAGALTIEHGLTAQFVGDRTPREVLNDPHKLLVLMRSTIARLCDYIDAASQFSALHGWHSTPECFDPDPQKRDLASLGLRQRTFNLMNQHTQVRWLNHMSDAVEQLKNSPKWAVYRQASSAPLPPRPWPTQQLDQAIIKLWPLVKYYRWRATDLLAVLRRLLTSDDLAPCPNRTALAAYCAGTLGLRRAGFKLSSPCGSEPLAVNVALHLCASEPSPIPVHTEQAARSSQIPNQNSKIKNPDPLNP